MFQSSVLGDIIYPYRHNKVIHPLRLRHLVRHLSSYAVTVTDIIYLTCDLDRYPLAAGRAPPSGFRIPLDANSVRPSDQELGPPPCHEPDGRTPIYIGSALLDT